MPRWPPSQCLRKREEVEAKVKVQKFEMAGTPPEKQRPAGKARWRLLLPTNQQSSPHGRLPTRGSVKKSTRLQQNKAKLAKYWRFDEGLSNITPTLSSSTAGLLHMKDYCDDGKAFKEHQLFQSSQHALQIQIYYDDIYRCL